MPFRRADPLLYGCEIKGESNKMRNGTISGRIVGRQSSSDLWQRTAGWFNQSGSLVCYIHVTAARLCLFIISYVFFILLVTIFGWNFFFLSCWIIEDLRREYFVYNLRLRLINKRRFVVSSPQFAKHSLTTLSKCLASVSQNIQKFECCHATIVEKGKVLPNRYSVQGSNLQFKYS